MNISALFVTGKEHLFVCLFYLFLIFALGWILVLHVSPYALLVLCYSAPATCGNEIQLYLPTTYVQIPHTHRHCRRLWWFYENGPHRTIESRTTSKGGLVGESVSLRGGLWVSGLTNKSFLIFQMCASLKILSRMSIA